MKLAEINHLLSLYDGNHSMLYPSIKDKLISYYDGVIDDDSPLWCAEEFMFFEDNYLLCARHIKEKNLAEKFNRIVDIGCQFGIQSLIFDEFEYWGVDRHKHLFYTDETLKTKYFIETFPHVSFSLKESAVISSMSLGYFNNELMGVTDKAIANKLSETEHLYISTTQSLLQELMTYFNNIETLNEYKLVNKIYGVWYLSK